MFAFSIDLTLKTNVIDIEIELFKCDEMCECLVRIENVSNALLHTDGKEGSYVVQIKVNIMMSTPSIN
jgi:hypothetical protein